VSVPLIVCEDVGVGNREDDAVLLPVFVRVPVKVLVIIPVPDLEGDTVLEAVVDEVGVT
jgi:hypothetical protein